MAPRALRALTAERRERRQLVFMTIPPADWVGIGMRIGPNGHSAGADSKASIDGSKWQECHADYTTDMSACPGRFDKLGAAGHPARVAIHQAVPPGSCTPPRLSSSPF